MLFVRTAQFKQPVLLPSHLSRQFVNPRTRVLSDSNCCAGDFNALALASSRALLHDRNAFCDQCFESGHPALLIRVVRREFLDANGGIAELRERLVAFGQIGITARKQVAALGRLRATQIFIDHHCLGACDGATMRHL